MVAVYKSIKISVHDHIGFLTFNRPEQLNAMNREMMNEIIRGIKTLNEDETVKVAVITGNGRAFMAGADIKEYATQTPEQFKSFQKLGLQLYSGIEEAPKPWIAAVNGFALGGGFEIALACDLIIASKAAKMGLPEVFLSLVPGGGATQRLVQKIGLNRVKEMLYFGGQYSSDQLFNWGIVNLLCDDELFEEEVFKYAKKLSRRPLNSVKELKKLAQLSLTSIPFEKKLEEEGEVVFDLFHQEEAKSAIAKFIDKI